MERMIPIRENDITLLIKSTRSQMEMWGIRDNISYRYCNFCRASEDLRGRFVHNPLCEGKAILSRFEEVKSIPLPVMGVIRLTNMIGEETIDPIEGLVAIKWLANKSNHNMESRTVLRLIRKLKTKLGIPL